MIKLPERFSPGVDIEDFTKPITPAQLGFSSDLANVVEQLAQLDTAAASALICRWLRGDIDGRDDFDRGKIAAQTVIFVHLALTDESWAAARAVIDVSDNLQAAFLAYGIGILGLEALPRLVEAHDAKGITKQARWQYRHAIVAALAVAASRGETWSAEHDRFLSVDQGWWFPKTQFILGNFHNDYVLGTEVMPLLRVAIAALPKPRAHAILDAALDETAPKKFPMCFFALPLLSAHWRAEYLERAITATCLGEDGQGRGFIDTPIWRAFHDDLIELGLLEKVLVQRYLTGHSRHRFEFSGANEKKLYALAEKLLPATQFSRFATNYKAVFGD